MFLIVGIIGTCLGALASAELGLYFPFDEHIENAQDKKARKRYRLMLFAGTALAPLLGLDQCGSTYLLWLLVATALFALIYLWFASQAQA